MTRTERDAEIGRSYTSGATMEEICKAAGLSKQRVQQILRQQGLKKIDRPKETSDRDEFLGVNLSELVKAALRQEAARRGISMSSLSSDTLRDMLVCCGYQVEAEQL